LGLPQDTLSASIISFARYFSLPLNPGLLAKIRRDALSPEAEKSAAGEALSPKGREGETAKAAALAAAAGKGVGLSPGGLEKYARFLSGQGAADPEPPAPSPNPAEPEEGAAGGGDEQGGGGFRHEGSGGDRREREDEERRTAPPGETRRTGKPLTAAEAAGAEKLRGQAIAAGEGDPLLNLLNRLPGKNGQRWIVFPFAAAGETGEFRVSLRLLLHETPSAHCPDRLVLDVSGGDQQSPDLRWLFVLDKPPEGASRLSARFWPPEDERNLISFKKALSRLLLFHPEQINLQNDEIFPLFEADYRNHVLPSVNKEV
jgi:hypothetical protein